MDSQQLIGLYIVIKHTRCPPHMRTAVTAEAIDFFTTKKHVRATGLGCRRETMAGTVAYAILYKTLLRSGKVKSILSASIGQSLRVFADTRLDCYEPTFRSTRPKEKYELPKEALPS